VDRTDGRTVGNASFALQKEVWNWNRHARRRRGRRKRSWRRAIEEEAEIVGKAWREVKAVDGNCALAFLCGGSVLRNATTRNWLDLPQYKSPRSSLCIFV